MNTRFLGVPWFVWGLLSLVLAVIFALVWPHGSNQSRLAGLQYFILRWFHSLVWLLLAASFFLRGAKIPGGPGIANMLALCALLTYLLFLFTVLRSLH